MKTLIVYTHPNPKSFNHSILKTVESTLRAKGHEVKVRDLYSEPFNAILDASDLSLLSQGKVPEDVKKEQELIAWADHLVFIYPIWWFERPALLKGWIDRVFTNGFAFSYGNGVKGLLKHQKALVIQTAGNTEEELRHNNIIEIIQRPMTEGTLEFCGIADVRVRTFAAVAKGSINQSEAMLKEVSEVLLKDW